MAFRFFRHRTAEQKQREIDMARVMLKTGGVLICIPIGLVAFGLAFPIFMPLLGGIAILFGLIAGWALLHGGADMLVAHTYGQRNGFFGAIGLLIVIGLVMTALTGGEFLRDFLP